MRALTVMMAVILMLQMGTLAYGLYELYNTKQRPVVVDCADLSMALVDERGGGVKQTITLEQIGKNLGVTKECVSLRIRNFWKDKFPPVCAMDGKIGRAHV